MKTIYTVQDSKGYIECGFDTRREAQGFIDENVERDAWDDGEWDTAAICVYSSTQEWKDQHPNG